MVCPLIARCKKKVDYETYREFCINIQEEKYKECDEYKKVMGVKRTPLEWNEFLGLTLQQS
ncbi:MAG: hypothetical protein NDF55_10660 [archaeon GB-1867-005]|nr:hypothetical protein [Candidatus Culexmicrobium cathedralense]